MKQYLNNVLIVGIVLWVAGALLNVLLPALLAVGLVLILLGKILTAIGVIILVIELLKNLLA